MKVLSIVSNRDAPFYRNQTLALEDHGCEITHIFPGRDTTSGRRQRQKRSLFDYINILPAVMSTSTADFDIIHANNGKVAPFALSQISCPVVLTLWGSDLMENYPTLCKTCSWLADEVIVPSPRMSSYLSTDHTVIPFGVDPSLFSPIQKEVAREKIGWNQNETIILFPYSKETEVKRYGVAKRVVDSLEEEVSLRTISGAPYEKMPIFMNASDVVLITSKRESGPMVVKEAALCNVPVVSTNVGFVEEVISGVQNSFVGNTEDELVSNLQRVLQNDCRSDGRESLITEVGLDRMARGIVDVYERVL